MFTVVWWTAFQCHFAVANCPLTLSPLESWAAICYLPPCSYYYFLSFLNCVYFSFMLSLTYAYILSFLTWRKQKTFVWIITPSFQKQGMSVYSLFSAQQFRLGKCIGLTDIFNQVWKSCKHAVVKTYQSILFCLFPLFFLRQNLTLNPRLIWNLLCCELEATPLP